MTRITPGWASAMNRPAATLLGLSALLAAAPASAVTLDNGVVLITQADALAGNVTPGDDPGFPVTLSVSGSYRFASNLLVNTASTGIRVTAPEVTIDLAGFRMAGSGVAFSAIIATQRALTVKNGTIRGFSAGINAFSADALTVKRMRIVDNQSAVLARDFASVSLSNFSRNAFNGIECKNFCRVENSIVAGNGFTGVQPFGTGILVLGNTLSGNGSRGVAASVGGSIGDNTIVGNPNGNFGTLPLDPNQPPPP